MAEPPRGTVVIREPETLIRIQALMIWDEELADARRCIRDAIDAAPDGNMSFVNVLMSALSQLDSVLNEVHAELQACRARGAILEF
jgi:hypothetical protein